ncbi:MAG: redoxin domain-containing protein [Bacteroidota bacterium]
MLISLLIIDYDNVSAQSVFPIKLNSISGDPVVLTPQKAFPFTVFIFLLPDCPACQSYTLTLKKLFEKFSQSGIRFIGVFAGKYSKEKEMNEFESRYQLPFPLYVDKNHDLIRKLDVHVSPEVVTIDQSGTVSYRGRIDDWMYAVGKKRTVIRHHDLENALRSISDGKKPDPDKTVPVGCIIE